VLVSADYLGTSASLVHTEEPSLRSLARVVALGVRVATGVFGERMAVELVNDGPVTIVL
jgi:D-Tyr-tRNAtyr deacylase